MWVLMGLHGTLLTNKNHLENTAAGNEFGVKNELTVSKLET